MTEPSYANINRTYFKASIGVVWSTLTRRCRYFAARFARRKQVTRRPTKPHGAPNKKVAMVLIVTRNVNTVSRKMT